MDDKLKQSNEFILENSRACYDSFPEQLKKEEDEFSKKIISANESNKNKLIKLYNFSDKILAQTDNFTACKSGCSHCCHMNVDITILEAEYIERNTGIKMKKINNSKEHEVKEFLGSPCPFLQENKCSIYKFRPFACRTHIAFDKTNYWCEIENCLTGPLQQIKFDYEKSYYDITKYSKTISADIRDFFGT